MAKGFVVHRLSPQIFFGLVGRIEVDQRAQHLEIGDQGIHLGQPCPGCRQNRET